MRGRYEEYPVYSVFTQLPAMDEPEVVTKRFSAILGLLLGGIWLGDQPWKPVPWGFTEFLHDLRRLRKSKRFAEIASIPAEPSSLQEWIEKLSASSSTISQNALELALEIQKRLQASDTKPEVRIQPPGQQQDHGAADEWKVRGKIVRREVATERPKVIAPRKISVKKSAPSKLGEDAAENEVSAFLVEASSAPNADELPEINTQSFLGLDARYATEFDNQLLPFSWEALNEHEVSMLVNAVVASLQSNESKNRTGALIVGLSIITSRSPSDLANFKLIFGDAAENLNLPAFVMDKSCWFSPFPKFDRFKPTTEQSAWLENTGEGCYLPLPVEILAALNEFGNDRESFKSALGISADECERLASEFCRSVRMDARSRVNVSWLRSIMFHRMHAISEDDVGTIATMGNTEHAPTVGLYYATFDQKKWREIYSRAITSIGLTPGKLEDEPCMPFGSRQLPDLKKLREWIQEFGETVEKQSRDAKTPSEVIAAHNMFTCYTFLMALANSGHRPSAQYTLCPSSYDLKNGWALISDKITSPTTRIRLIPLSDMVIHQFGNYETHLHNLSVRFFEYEPNFHELMATHP